LAKCTHPREARDYIEYSIMGEQVADEICNDCNATLDTGNPTYFLLRSVRYHEENSTQSRETGTS
jgi:hypothetical protein